MIFESGGLLKIQMNILLMTLIAISSCFTAAAMDPSSPELRRDKIDTEELNEQLIEAAKNGNLEAVQSLAAVGADVNAKCNEGITALMEAVSFGHMSIVKYLVSCKADVDAADHRGNTALMYAALNMRTSIVEYLVSCGADVNAGDKNGCTVLIYTATNSYIEILESLLKAGADVKARDCNGDTALMFAAFCGHGSCVELLLQYGADYTLKNNEDKDALALAEMRFAHHRNDKYTQIIEILSSPVKISNLVSKRFVKEHQTNSVCDALLNRELGYKNSNNSL